MRLTKNTPIKKIGDSHISTHENRKNVLSYGMDDSELTVDYGITEANLIDFDEMPHKINKKAFTLKVQRTQDGSNLFKGRFNFNLFKQIRDNLNQNYAACIEIYFKSSQFYEKEFDTTKISFEKMNMHINYNATK